MDEDTLRQKAREAVQAGKLPNRRPTRMWGGPGGGGDCTICGSPLKHEEVEFDLEFARDDKLGDLGNYQVHLRCFKVWELERQNVLQPTSSSPISNGHVLSSASNDGTISACERDTRYGQGSV